MNTSDPRAELTSKLQFVRQNAGFRWLTDCKILRVTGEDQREWLSRMLTQHCASLKLGDSCFTAAVSVKGKLFGTLYLHARAATVAGVAESLLVIPSQTAEAFLVHLEKHVIMEDVELALLPALNVLTIQGAQALRLASSLCATAGGTVLGPLPANRLGLQAGFDLLVPSEMMDPVSKALSTEASLVELSAQAWEELRLEGGVAEFMKDFSGENYVQEANITAQTVSFNKGCYIGQEVVCMLEMRGHVRRQLVHVTLEAMDETEVPSGGQPLDDEAGVITSAVFSHEKKKVIAFAMVKWDLAKERKPMTLGGRPLSFVEKT